MAKRNQTTTSANSPDALVVNRDDFRVKLEELINQGESLISRQISTNIDLEKVKEEFSTWDDYVSEYLKHAFNNENSDYKHQFDIVNNFGGIFLGGAGPTDKVADLRKDIKDKVAYLRQLHVKVDLLKLETSSITVGPPVKGIDTSSGKVFIVHGHNEVVKLNVARTLDKLGLKPIILHEQPNGGKTLIEKFEEYSDVGFAIVIMTDDDHGNAKSATGLNLRARQNVILELGYFIGKLSRKRVVPLLMEGIEKPSDIHGLAYVEIDAAGKWQYDLIRELKEAGYNIDANKLY